MLQNNVPHATAEVQLVVSSGRHAPAAGVERVWGAGVGGGAGRRGLYAAPPPPAPSPMDWASSVVLLSPRSLKSPATVPPEGEGAAGQGQEGAVTAGTGEGEPRADKRRRALG